MQSIENPLNAKELAKLLHIHPVTLLRWVREGRIPHRRLSARRIVFLPSAINQWLSNGEPGYPTNAVCAAPTQ
jgi:excisionase family DNA binding protein